MHRCVLLIDDDPDDRELFMEALEEITEKIRCFTATDGRRALARLREIPAPDLIIIDVNMPVMDGWACLGALKQAVAWKEIPVVMYSTSSHGGDPIKAKNNGASCFFTKPYSFTGLKKCLAIIIHHLETGELSKLPPEISPL